MPKPRSKSTAPPKAPRETPESILNEEPPLVTTDFDHGAEVTQASEREAVADDYEANARLDDIPDDAPMDDFSDEQDTADRPDTAAMFEEEGEEEEDEI